MKQKSIPTHQLLFEHAKAAGIALSKRAMEAGRTKGRNAAWRVIFNAICNEGVYVREASPAALVTYQAYVSFAAGFLKDHPNHRMVLELTGRIVEDLQHHGIVFNAMTKETFTEDECITIMASMNILKTTLQSLIVQHQK